MDERQLMELAIEEARKCKWPSEDDVAKPKVGAVISIDGEPIAQAHRGNNDHAEKSALSLVIEGQHDLSQATVWTTLEPCTRMVRREEGESCTERLIAASVKKVLVGILDPNQGVCGKGLLKLQEHGIEVGLFPHDLALKIRRLNDSFIRDQQTLGIKITSPRDGEVFSTSEVTITGTFINPPDSKVIVMTYVEPVEALGFDGGWWPQGQVRIVPGADREWDARVQFGVSRLHKIYIVRANELGFELIKYFDALKDMRRHVILKVAGLYCRDSEHVRHNIAPLNWPLPTESSMAN